MVEEDSPESLRVLVASALARGACFGQDAVSAQDVREGLCVGDEAPVRREVVACRGYDAADEVVRMLEVGGVACGLPETAQAGQYDALVVGVDVLVAVVALVGCGRAMSRCGGDVVAIGV